MTMELRKIQSHSSLVCWEFLCQRVTPSGRRSAYKRTAENVYVIASEEAYNNKWLLFLACECLKACSH